LEVKRPLKVKSSNMKNAVGIMKCQSWFSEKPLVRWWRQPAVWQGWLVVVVLMATGIGPLAYFSVVYKGDTYCQSVIDQGIQTDCNPQVATSVYIMGSISWLVAMLMVLHVVSTKQLSTKQHIATEAPKSAPVAKKPKVAAAKKEKRAAKQ
jgi:hypothetical protein